MNSTPQSETLAIHGGPKVRERPMPFREAFGDAEVESLMEAVEYYRGRHEDPPYQGVFEKKLCDAFVAFQGEGGHADGVASGTIACHVALAALNLPKGCDVVISPVTDSGPLNSIILQGYRPVLADSAPDSFNMGIEQFLDCVTPNTKAVMAVHTGGEPLEIDRLVEEAHRRDIKVVEDCSQAPGATWKGRRVGTYGDTAAFSTMYRKSLTAGASGGIVYTKDLDLFRQAIAHADRGKQPWRTDINQNDPSGALFPALNCNTDELSCAIGLASLARLQDTIDRRVAFLRSLVQGLANGTTVCRPYAFHDGFSPFYFPIFVDTDRLSCSKTDFANAVQAEGIALNAHYGCVISGWEWAIEYLPNGAVAPNAEHVRDHSFNLFINERYEDSEMDDVLTAIRKVEAHYLRGD